MSKKEYKKKIVFLFGAGAEDCFGTPLGPEYTRKSIFVKKPHMMDALANFYKLGNRFDKYEKRYLFSESSHTLCEIMLKVAYEAKLENKQNEKHDFNKYKKLIELSYDIEKAHISEHDEKWKLFKEELRNRYNDLILDEFSDSNKELDELLKNITFYGAIEKDFSTIINPKEAGYMRYSRIVNYFWSAYFSILLPVLKDIDEYKETSEKHQYENILNNLSRIISDIYSDEFAEIVKRKYNKGLNNYYEILSAKYNESTVITTNYTPYTGVYWNSNKVAYVAGKLSWMEDYENLNLIDYSNKKDCYVGNVFPCIATQAPIKPIVFVEQMEEYSKANEVLKDKCDYLVIIGYGINENDNHINAMIHKYVDSGNIKKLIYVKHLKDDEKAEKNDVKARIAKKLKLGMEPSSRIEVIESRGNAKAVVQELKKIIGV